MAGEAWTMSAKLSRGQGTQSGLRLHQWQDREHPAMRWEGKEEGCTCGQFTADPSRCLLLWGEFQLIYRRVIFNTDTGMEQVQGRRLVHQRLSQGFVYDKAGAQLLIFPISERHIGTCSSQPPIR